MELLLKAWPGCSAQMIADSSGSVARAAALEALQAFTGERTARPGPHRHRHAPVPRHAYRIVEHHRTRQALRQLLDALDEVDKTQSSLRQLIQDLQQDAGSEIELPAP